MMDNILKNKVAVVGIGCRFPSAKNWREFWDLLAKGKCTIGELPASRTQLDFRHSKDSDRRYKCGYLDNIDMFDPLFFGITPREAARMDPQHRLLLEVLWEAFEDAGIAVKELAGSDTGVFIGTGISFSHYFEHQFSGNMADIYSVSGAQPFAAANRISYIFDFRGPSFAVDSACSTSMIAINEAYTRICSGECSVTVAGGANLLLSSDFTDLFQKARLIAPDGLCKAFDENADGYVRGEGIGVVILKSLEKAIEDGNDIWTVISGASFNHGGRNGRGFTYPNADAQRELLKTAYRNAGVLPSEVHYIETHGTGTPVGDKIELNGINGVVSEGRKSGDYCMVGTVKTNIGHLESASGIAAFIKTCLIIKEKQIPPSLHFKQFSRNIDVENMPIRVQTELKAWPENKKLIAGISSFGLGGANLHMVLESVENFATTRTVNSKKRIDTQQLQGSIFPVSGHNLDALAENVENYLSFIEKNPEIDFYDLCYSASERKDHLRHRLAILCRDKKDLMNKLSECISQKQNNTDVFYGESVNGKSAKVVFVFSDSHEKWLNSDLLQLFKIPLFVEVLQQMDMVYNGITGVSILAVVAANTLERIYSNAILSDVLYFAFQVSLYKLWQKNGVSPGGLLGYGQGEIAAAYLSGMLALDTAVQLVYDRAKRMDAVLTSGKMFNVMASVEEIKEFIDAYHSNVYIAAANSPTVLTLSGEVAQMEKVAEQMERKGYFFRELPGKWGMYCPLMASNQKSFAEVLRVEMGEAKIPLYSTAIDSSGVYREYSPGYWEQQITGRIDFAGRIRERIEAGSDKFIEIGDGSLLSFYISDTWDQMHLEDVCLSPAVISSLKKSRSLEDSIKEGIAELYVRGYPLKWENIFQKGTFVKLPNYAWQRQSYWI
ncbi:type I polyketide synthase [Marinisporobacter balticus]|uniref:Acyl transferase domain-containing protein n=1 Tax=Marinisporobacter balticus TaxID=2018667 RepID=A0A4R2KDL3_9FIRM|nr:type I polyketide synthase [Marinisporobacter balticus]TCO70412.1 acyl transferase domain-containing protein [Marinisporobacter balticus]